MTATNHTERYGLSQCARDDHPTYTGDCNGDMSKIAAAIYVVSFTGGTDGLTAVAHDGMLTGDATGLTAAQLDTQYPDDYNIVRTGMSTCSIESEESHHE